MPIHLPFATTQLSLHHFGCEIFSISLTCLGDLGEEQAMPREACRHFHTDLDRVSWSRQLAEQPFILNRSPTTSSNFSNS
jgi:hypothetical protein